MDKLYIYRRLQKLYRLKEIGFNYIDGYAHNIGQDIDLPANLPALHKIVEGCHLCNLSKVRLSTTVSQPRGRVKVMMVFERNISETPNLVIDGRSRDMIENMVVNVLKMQMEEVYVTSLIKCFIPLGSVVEEEAFAQCGAYFNKEVEILGPDAILAFGDNVFKHLTGRPRQPGFVGNLSNIEVVGSHTPAHILRNPSLKKVVFQDLMTLKRIVDEKSP